MELSWVLQRHPHFNSVDGWMTDYGWRRTNPLLLIYLFIYFLRLWNCWWMHTERVCCLTGCSVSRESVIWPMCSLSLIFDSALSSFKSADNNTATWRWTFCLSGVFNLSFCLFCCCCFLLSVSFIICLISMQCEKREPLVPLFFLLPGALHFTVTIWSERAFSVFVP